MATRTITVLEPDFYKDFGCVGAACRNNCCNQQWKIIVDKTAYKKLRTLREPKWLKENFSQYVRRNQDSINDSDYSLLQKDAEGHCPFQTEEGWCRLHAELGPEYLCDTCKTFPRYRAVLPEIAAEERGLCCSCEEVARLLLAHPEPIQYHTHTEELPIRFDNVAYKDVNSWIMAKNRPIMAHYMAIRAVLTGLLQAREYEFSQRLILVCLLLDKLAALEESNQPEQVPAELDKFVAAVDGKLYDALLQKDFGVDAAKFYAGQGWAYAFAAAAHQEKPAQPLLLCYLGLEKADYTERMARYQQFFQEKGHIIEHLFVSDVWNKCIPFFGEYSIRENLCYLVSTYAVLRQFWGGYLSAKGTMTDLELIDNIAFFGKVVLHSKANFTVNIELLQKNDMTTLPYLLAIIKG